MSKSRRRIAVLPMLIAAAIIASLVVSPQTATSAAYHRSTSASPSLTPQGQLLWNFEALLVETFGSRQPSVSGRENFSCAGSCSPLSTYSPYTYSFTHLGTSNMRLSSRNVSNANFGNYPVPVLIRGKGIACNSAGTKFVIVYKDQSSFTLGCLAPQ